MTKLIALDNGHGISTAGKRSPIFTDGTKSPLTGKNFFHEWEYNRGVVIYLDAELKRCGFKTVQVSPTDEDTPITTRANRARQSNADLLLSVHANALNGKWGTHGGIEQLVCGAESTRIGRLIQEEMVKELKLRDRGCKDGCWLGLVKSSGKIPVVLVEGFFMDGINESKLGFSDDFMKRSAIAIAKGICRAYGVNYVPHQPSKSIQQQQIKHEGEFEVKIATLSPAQERMRQRLVRAGLLAEGYEIKEHELALMSIIDIQQRRIAELEKKIK